MKKITFLIVFIFTLVTFGQCAGNILVIGPARRGVALDGPSTYTVFNKTAAYKGHEAHRIMRINNQQLSRARINISAYNGSHSYCDVIFNINNRRFVAISRLAPFRQGSGSISIPVSVLQYGQDLRVVSFVDTFAPTSWVKVSLTVYNHYVNPQQPSYPPTPGILVNINTANVNELSRLQGVGVTRARAIVDWRYRHGRFNSIHQLASVPGFSMTMVNRLTPYITISGGYKPPTPPNPHNNNVDRIIKRAENAATYKRGDDILINGARRVRSLKGLLKLSAHAHYRTTTDQILAIISRGTGQLQDLPTYNQIQRTFNQYSTYVTGDNMLKAIKFHVNNATDSIKLSILANYRETSKELLLYVKQNYRRMNNYPSARQLVNFSSQASSYQIGDDILITGSPMMHNQYDFDTLIDAATYRTTKEQIRKIRQQMYGYNNGYNNGHGNVYSAPRNGRRRENLVEEVESKDKFIFSKDAIEDIGKIYEIKEPTIKAEEISEMSIDRIRTLSKSYRDKKIKHSPRNLKSIIKLKEKVNALKLSGQVEDIDDVVENLK
ncbi:helix-hairpin-helix domain-containing protein [bacterium]|nr:helix-hairpin-helix domain-containing protein [bacterium]